MSAPGRRRYLSWLFVSLIALALLGGLAFYRPFDSVGGTALATEEAPAPPPPPPLPEKRITFLVMGVDKRPDDFGRADSMLVVSFDPAADQLAVVSLARDTWVEIPGHGYDKLNHSYAYGGEKLAVSTVQGLLGIPIDHYVTVSFQGFEKIVDALGGVEIEAEKRMLYHDPYDLSMGPDGLVIDIEPGLQQMDGETALKYARFRMDDEGDLGRIRRQQQVAKALMKKAAQPSVVGRIPQLIPALSDAISTDLSLAEMLQLAAGGKGALANPLKTGTLGGRSVQVGGIYYLIPDLVAERKAAYEILVGDSPQEDFLKRARQDQAAYAGALDEALAAAEAEAPPPEAEDEPDEPPVASGPKPGAGTPDGKTKPGSGSGSGAKQPPKLPSKQQPITVAVIDASGRQLGAEYVAKLKAAGFRVARVGKVSKPVARTVALDHTGQSGNAQRLKAVLPNVLVVAAPDSKAGEALEIILGQDLVPKKQD